MEKKLENLKARLNIYKSAVIAFSGGVDSTFLSRIAKDIYGDNLLLITATSSTYPFYELEEATSLAESGFSKTDIRDLSTKLQLPTATKQSYACLASRFPYGEKITKVKLDRLAMAEFEVRNLGFTQFRIRSHENLARFEFIPEEMNKAWELKRQLTDICKKSGFIYITIDLTGYRTGSMNEVLSDLDKQCHQKKTEE
ncbi:MAG TPA: hypothetical protein DDY34_17260 [Bacteroidales bacterium]|nr:hypothetical protein [Bacteroidales bacterium]